MNPSDLIIWAVCEFSQVYTMEPPHTNQPKHKVTAGFQDILLTRRVVVVVVVVVVWYLVVTIMPRAPCKYYYQPTIYIEQPIVP